MPTSDNKQLTVEEAAYKILLLLHGYLDMQPQVEALVRRTQAHCEHCICPCVACGAKEDVHG